MVGPIQTSCCLQSLVRWWEKHPLINRDCCVFERRLEKWSRERIHYIHTVEQNTGDWEKHQLKGCWPTHFSVNQMFQHIRRLLITQLHDNRSRLQYLSAISVGSVYQTKSTQMVFLHWPSLVWAEKHLSSLVASQLNIVMWMFLFLA